MDLKQQLQYCSASGTALLAVNFYNFETLKGLLLAAKANNCSLILQLSEGTLQYLGIHSAVNMARAALRQFGVRGWIHLDHGNNISTIRECLDAGFDSVMIDASEASFSENVKTTSAVVKLAEAYNVNVEAELGYIAKLGQQQQGAFTSPADAHRFVSETGVNALAVAIGTAHGFYKDPPNLQIALLKEIHAATPAALVLHGSSGVPDDQLKAAVKNGIAKVNLATETKNIFMKTLQQQLRQTEDIDLRRVFPKAIDAVTSLISQKLQVI
ncbi:class II fructose-bisphosphate aldolase [Chitinophaga oryzae]|uniref:Class II fructose-bisphosphate aldolase n=1 Tax=Chitinophaga oryzae TaxID=2725414 RepID=A0AAE6ZD79_9BACT|nr:class II fructose-bisphosphate aldolase [Chitinophaga oryzae]QJB30611.1 class II fructose-bisphosphate aldolase [Chitinophaga oryzae]QJB37111.1 class II fructose-bisphosphate aldolase [Chitinophaga oryzae]